MRGRLFLGVIFGKAHHRKATERNVIILSPKHHLVRLQRQHDHSPVFLSANKNPDPRERAGIQRAASLDGTIYLFYAIAASPLSSAAITITSNTGGSPAFYVAGVVFAVSGANTRGIQVVLS
jgi:hypothetical protein